MRSALPIVAIIIVAIGFLAVVYAYSGTNGFQLPELPVDNQPSEQQNPEIPVINEPSEPKLPGEGTKVTLTISVIYETTSSPGSIEPSVGSHEYAKFMFVTVTAKQVQRYAFRYWVFDGQQQSNENPIQIYMDSDHSLMAYYTQTEIPSEEPEEETYGTKTFLSNYVITPSLGGSGGYEGSVSITYDYPVQGQPHEVALSYQKMSDLEIFSKLFVKRNDVIVFQVEPEDLISHDLILDSNSQAEHATYTIRWICNEPIKLTVSLYVSHWPTSGLSVFGDSDMILQAFGIVAILAGAIMLVIGTRR